ncbi:MAG: hypothetical protein K2O97_09120 [Acetatifactor sp.]|nr:hypothetical protein [Acetatifactor sp.]
MRLIDAEKIEGFASHYTEFDGKPLTEREKDLVKNVCGTISGQMPTAYDIERVMEQLEEKKEQFLNSKSADARFRKYCMTVATGVSYATDIVKAGGTDDQTDPF